MSDAPHHSIVAIYDQHSQAEQAVIVLQKAGFDMTTISIMGRHIEPEEHVVGFETPEERIVQASGGGMLWGGLWGMLFSTLCVMVPGVGPFLMVGPVVGLFLGTISGAAIGGAASLISSSLSEIGLSKESVVKYELALKEGKYLLLINGPAALIERGRELLGTTQASLLTAHSPQTDEARAESAAEALAIASVSSRVEPSDSVIPLVTRV